MNAEPTQPTSPVPDAGEFVLVDTPCRECGYSLRGMLPASRCPECGTPVADSVGGDILARSTPADLRRTVGGIRGVLWATLLFVFILAAANVMPPGAAGTLDDIIFRARVQLVLETAGGLVLAAAHWRLGGRLGAGAAAHSRVRRFYRASVAAAVVAQLAGAVPRAMWYWPLSTDARTAMQVAMWAGNITLAVTAVAFLLYLRELAQRIPSAKLARAAAVLVWLCGVSLAVYQGLGLWVLFAKPQNLDRVFVTVLVVAGLAGTTFLVGTAASMYLLHRLRVALTRALNAAMAG